MNSSDHMREVRACLLLAVAAAAAFANSFSGALLFDDHHTLARVMSVQGLGDLAGARPLTIASLLLNYHLTGLSPWSYHLFNLTVHVLAGWTLFGVVRRVLELEIFRGRFTARAHTFALVIALLWLVHPLQTQSVTYIVQRAESLMGLFYLLTIYCVLRGHGSPLPARWYAAAAVACGLGMASKAVMVTAPVVVLLLDRTLLTASFGEVWRRRAGLYAGLAASWLVLPATGFLSVFGVSGTGTVGLGVEDVTPVQYALTQPQVILHYLSLCVWPAALCLDYAWPIADAVPTIAVSTTLLAGLFAVSVWGLRSHPGLGFTGVAFFLVLAPTSSVVPVADLAVEHRMYLPLAAAIGVLVFAASSALEAAARRQPALRRRAVPVTLVAVAAVALGWRTVERNRDYHEPARMWRTVLEHRPANARAHTELASYLSQEGRTREAIDHLQRAITLQPDHCIALGNLASTLVRAGRHGEAIEAGRRAVERCPRQATAHYALGHALLAAGALDEALVHLREMVVLEPRQVMHRTDLGRALLLVGGLDAPPERRRPALLDEGMMQLAEAVRIDPRYEPAQQSLADAADRSGDIDAQLAPWLGEPGFNTVRSLAWVLRADRLRASGRLDLALEASRHAITADPDNALARAMMAELGALSTVTPR